jgi:hypothetical protein
MWEDRHMGCHGVLFGNKRLGQLIAGAAAAVLISSCGGDETKDDPGSTTTQPESAIQSLPPSASAPEILEGGGQYETTIFEPRVSITLPDGDWETAAAETADSFAIRHALTPNRDAIVALVRIAKVFDPSRGGDDAADAIAVPDDFTKFLTSHPNLRATSPQPAQALGLSGESVDVEVIGTPPQTPAAACGDKPCLPLYLDGKEPIVFSPGDRMRYYVLDGPDGQLIAELYVSPGDRFEADVPALEDALAGFELSE